MENVKGYSNIVNIEDYAVISSTGGQPWYILIRMELFLEIYAAFAIPFREDRTRPLPEHIRMKIIHGHDQLFVKRIVAEKYYLVVRGANSVDIIAQLYLSRGSALTEADYICSTACAAHGINPSAVREQPRALRGVGGKCDRR